jgi:hypothetical protein
MLLPKRYIHNIVQSGRQKINVRILEIFTVGKQIYQFLNIDCPKNNDHWQKNCIFLPLKKRKIDSGQIKKKIKRLTKSSDEL